MASPQGCSHRKPRSPFPSLAWFHLREGRGFSSGTFAQGKLLASSTGLVQQNFRSFPVPLRAEARSGTVFSYTHGFSSRVLSVCYLPASKEIESFFIAQTAERWPRTSGRLHRFYSTSFGLANLGPPSMVTNKKCAPDRNSKPPEAGRYLFDKLDVRAI